MPATAWAKDGEAARSVFPGLAPVYAFASLWFLRDLLIKRV
jgi:hypothetical protein